MTRKDTDGGSGGDQEPGSCSSRPSISETSWADAQKPSVPNEFTSTLTSIRQQFPLGDDSDKKIISTEKQEPLEEARHDKCLLRADCPIQAIQVTGCEPSDAKMEPLMVSTASSSSSVSGQTRLPTSLLFELPDSRRGSTTPSDKMPAISKAQMKEFEEAFNLFDKDRDGSITKEELGRVMRGLGQFARTEELRTMLEEIDTDGDGNVSLVEFVKIVSNIGNASAAQQTDLTQEQQEEQELRDAFRVFDKHNRGYITASDLRAVLQCLGEDLSEEEIEDMIKEVDEDGDGRIDFCEFARSLVNPSSDNEDEEEDDELPQSPLS
ncbi:myosin regulatory light chain 2 isoform X2 [Microplitis mediator]|uniref:myosin regulatory light chain 2 isoform X2 n=1 Tax=Microplitis mediator TaxID=375433 RepID=UPI002557B531|nr:myosin regulatory light chain 2 isoform X2 [Microplitis mediator]XP_057318249.1 myosin regulatory light chain 2 isoform X2 [Microplitis mediator]